MSCLGTNSLPSRMLNTSITRQGVAVTSVYCLLVLTGLLWTISAGSLAFLCTLAVLGIALVSSSETCCRLMFVCLPFFNIMGIDLGGTSSFYILVVLFAAKSLLDGTAGGIGRRLAAYAVVATLTSYNITAGVSYLGWLIHLLPFMLLLGTNRLRCHLPIYVKYLTVSMILSSVIGQAMMDAGVYLYTFGSVRTGAEVTTRFTGLVGDAVVYGQFISVVIAANAYLAFAGRGYRLLAPCCVILVFYAFLTYSKGALVSLALVGVFVLAAFSKRMVERGFPVRYALFVLVAVVAAFLGAGFMVSGESAFSLDALLTRLDSSDLLTARRQIWDGYFSLWEQTGLPMVFKGIGFDTYTATTIYGRWHNCHNIYIEAVTLFGFIGALAIAVALVYFLLSRSRRGARAMSYLPCFVLLATGVILHGFLDFPFFYIWTLALGCVDYDAAIHRNAGENNFDRT